MKLVFMEELYKARPEVACVVHAHPPWPLFSVAWAESSSDRSMAATTPSSMRLSLKGIPVYPNHPDTQY